MNVSTKPEEVYLALILVTVIDGYSRKFLAWNILKHIFPVEFVVDQVALG
jgi:hypothetical protein